MNNTERDPQSCKTNVSGSETWIRQQENTLLKKMKEQTEYLFELSHYDWMYRATLDTKHLEEKRNFITKK